MPIVLSSIDVESLQVVITARGHCTALPLILDGGVHNVDNSRTFATQHTDRAM